MQQSHEFIVLLQPSIPLLPSLNRNDTSLTFCLLFTEGFAKTQTDDDDGDIPDYDYAYDYDYSTNYDYYADTEYDNIEGQATYDTW